MGRPDIEPDISFLCTILNDITKEEKDKLRLMLQYLKHKINDKMIMGTDSLIQLCPWVDAVYGVDPDLKSHTGGCIYFKYGMVHCNSRNQKLIKKVPPGPK